MTEKILKEDTRAPGGWEDRAMPSPVGAGCIRSDALFGDANVVLIQHQGQTYVLRKTRQDKLILTK